MVGSADLAAEATRGAPAGLQGPRRILSRDDGAGSKHSWGEVGGTARGVWRRPPSRQRRGRDRRPFVPPTCRNHSPALPVGWLGALGR